MVVTARPILYGESWMTGDKGVSRHAGQELGVEGAGGSCVSSERTGGQPSRCCLSLLLTCLNYSGLSAVSLFRQLTVCLL